jgi:hypothetical protein
MNQEIINDMTDILSTVTAQVENTHVYQLFTKVPSQQKITYVTHVWRGIKRSVQLGYAALCIWLYAFFPFLFEMFPAIATEEVRKEMRKSIVVIPTTSDHHSVLKPEKVSVYNESTAL